MLYILAILQIAVLILLIVLITGRNSGNDTVKNELKTVSDIVSKNQRDISELQGRQLDEIRKTVEQGQRSNADVVSGQLKNLESRFLTLEQTNEQKLENLRRSINENLDAIRKDNNERLEQMRVTVDEKLQKTLETKMTESFKLVNDRLAEVYKGLGEMQTLATGVGDLKKVLSNVKTRGILGEIQLGSILSEILAPEQYRTNFATVPGSRVVVEFAVKLPGNGEKPVYLPIDSKFPADCYIKLMDAYESGTGDEIKAAQNELTARIKAFAKDIRTKYISPPDTTDFGIMFLPFEGLYAEVLKLGLVETLQRDFHINVTGPSTMAAMLNSLQMGFRTLAIQKRSAEVWKILGAVRTEFDKFAEILEKTKKKLGQIDSDLDALVGTRSNAIRRKLRDVEKISGDESAALLDE